MILTVIMAVAVTSCSVSKAAHMAQNAISGSWTLTDVHYEGSEGTFSSILFNDASAQCFEGSDWFFRDNNSTGRYTLEGSASCAGGARYIRWSVLDRGDLPSQLQFKFIDEKRNDVSGGLGYRLDISYLNETNMTLQSHVSVDGQPITVVYEFVKK